MVPSRGDNKKIINEITRLINLCPEDSPFENIHCVKSSKYGVFSGPYFPVFGLNTGKYGPEKTPYLDTFHAEIALKAIHVLAALLLQKQNEHSKAKDLVVALERKLELCENGNIIKLLNRGEANRERLPTSERSKDIAKISVKFKAHAKRQRKWSIEVFN